MKRPTGWPDGNDTSARLGDAGEFAHPTPDFSDVLDDLAGKDDVIGVVGDRKFVKRGF